MAWIKTISYNKSVGKLRKIYDKVKGPDDTVDNILLVHSLRPHTLTGHMALYKNVLHNLNNTLPKWFLESIGVYVSILNQCNYCVKHHSAGMKRLINDEDMSKSILTALQAKSPEKAFDGKELEALKYASKLAISPGTVEKDDITSLRNSGYTDGEILEINQVVSYFAYANRTVTGLGVDTKGDILGLSPYNSDDPNNWSHA